MNETQEIRIRKRIKNSLEQNLVGHELYYIIDDMVRIIIDELEDVK